MSVDENTPDERPVMLVPVRWQKDQPRLIKGLPPMAAEHPLAETGCLGCDEPLANGKAIVLLAVGPSRPESEGYDDEERKHAAGGWYTADGVTAHEDCQDAVTAILEVEHPRER